MAKKSGFNQDIKESLFCEYFVLCAGNATEAAKRANYPEGSAAEMGRKLLKKDYIKDKIIELFNEKRKMINTQIDDIVVELHDRTFMDPREMFDEYGMLKKLQALPGRIARAVQKFKLYETAQGDLIKEVHFVDKTKNTELLMKHLGMLQERIQLDINKSEVLCFVHPEVQKFELPDDDPILTGENADSGKVLFSNTG